MPIAVELLPFAWSHSRSVPVIPLGGGLAHPSPTSPLPGPIVRLFFACAGAALKLVWQACGANRIPPLTTCQPDTPTWLGLRLGLGLIGSAVAQAGAV